MRKELLAIETCLVVIQVSTNSKKFMVLLTASFNALASSFIISDTVALSKIKINIASFKELNKHPYISFEQTKDILNSKSKSGKFRKVDDLYRLTSFDSLAIEKIAPYLDFK